MHDAQATPKHLISDKGSQFWCDGFKEWCRDNGIKPRFGAIGQHGSIAITERLILTLKQGIGWFLLVLLRREAFRTMLGHLAAWYNAHRPHASLAGRTPDEVYHRKRAANHQPRFEPRPRWPRASGCAKPVMLVKGAPGVRRDASASTFSSVFGAHGARRRANQTTFRHQITLVIDCFHF